MKPSHSRAILKAAGIAMGFGVGVNTEHSLLGTTIVWLKVVHVFLETSACQAPFLSGAKSNFGLWCLLQILNILLRWIVQLSPGLVFVFYLWFDWGPSLISIILKRCLPDLFFPTFLVICPCASLPMGACQFLSQRLRSCWRTRGTMPPG